MKKYGLMLLGLILTILLLNTSTLAAEDPPVQAKVYFICKPEIVTQGIFLFSDDQFLTFLKTGTYFQANLKPGIHFIWYSAGNKAFPLNELEFIPGQSYYLDIGVKGRHQLLSPVNGAELLERVALAVPLDEIIKKRASVISAKYYLTKLVKPENPITDSIKSVIANNGPSLLQVPKYTPIKLTFAEKVASKINKANDLVGLQVMAPVVVNGKICISKGTLVKGLIRKVAPARGCGVPGFIDVIIPELQISGNTNLSVIGRYITTGIPKKDYECPLTSVAAFVGLSAGIVGGVLGELIGYGAAASLKGPEAIINIGDAVIVYTRDEAWVKPDESALPINTLTSSQADPYQTLKAQIPQEAIFPYIGAPSVIDLDKAYGYLFTQINKNKLGNRITFQVFNDFKTAISQNGNSNEVPALTCAKAANGYYLKVKLNICFGFIQPSDNGTFELYDPNISAAICRVEAEEDFGISYNDASNKLIKKGVKKLLEELKKVKPTLIKASD